MALPREEQAKIIRIVASMLSAGFNLRDALLSLAEDYRNYGLIEIEGSLRDYVPRALRKGWVSEELEEMASAIDRGRKEEEVIRETEIFDEDVKDSLSSALASGSVEKMAGKLADLLELEVMLLGKMKKVLIAPILSGVVALIFTYVMVFRLVPKIVSSVTYKERLPQTVKSAYLLSQHPILFFAAVFLLIGLSYYFLKSGVWKSYLPAYKLFERLRFLNWFKILMESGWREVETFQFLSQAGFSKKWREAIEDGLSNLEAGEGLDRVTEDFYQRGLIAATDLSFIKSGIRVGNLPKQLEPDLKFLSGETDREMEKTTVLVQVFFLIIVGIYVIGLYLGILLPLTTSVQKVM